MLKHGHLFSYLSVMQPETMAFVLARTKMSGGRLKIHHYVTAINLDNPQTQTYTANPIFWPVILILLSFVLSGFVLIWLRSLRLRYDTWCSLPPPRNLLGKGKVPNTFYSFNHNARFRLWLHRAITVGITYTKVRIGMELMQKDLPTFWSLGLSLVVIQATKWGGWFPERN